MWAVFRSVLFAQLDIVTHEINRITVPSLLTAVDHSAAGNLVVVVAVEFVQSPPYRRCAVVS